MTTYSMRTDGEAPEELKWRDAKRYLWILSLVPAMAPLGAWGFHTLAVHYAPGAGWLAALTWWTGPLIVFGLVPFFDVILGADRNNAPDWAIELLEETMYYRWVTWLFLPVQLLSTIVCCYLWSDRFGPQLNIIDSVGLAFSLAMSSGIGITCAHELGHKKEELERWLAKLVLALPAYGHFYVEHNRGHHVRVATPEDPASSRFGESFYEFYPRTVIFSAMSAWKLEKSRFARQKKTPWHISNDVLNAWAMTVVLFGGLTLIFGWRVLPFLLLQAFLGFSLLEVVNYLEHYGLMRQKLPSGRYERCREEHSWNNNNIVTNIFLYHLQRHSDHHARPTRRYQALQDSETAPALPFGYATMIWLAVIPPLWNFVMDKRVLKHYNGDITLANILPRKKDKILRKYGAKSSV